MWGDISLCFSFAFPWWSVILSIFPCVYWLSVCLFWKDVYLGLLSVFNWVAFFFKKHTWGSLTPSYGIPTFTGFHRNHLFISCKINRTIWSLLTMRIIRLSLSLPPSPSNSSHPYCSRESTEYKDMVPWSQLLMRRWALDTENLLLNYSPRIKVLSDWCGMMGWWWTESRAC